jgi:signal transduction histidine kinase
MHKLLDRQLRRAFGARPQPVGEAWTNLLAAVDAAYRQADDDRRLVERSLDLTSQELVEKNLALREELEALHRAEERASMADRMASLGTLAAGVAHEINNPLAYVVANLQFIQEELASGGAVSGSEMGEALTAALEGASRVRAIVRDLKAFSRSDDADVTAVDVGAVLRSAINMASHESRHRAQVVVQLASVPPVAGTPSKLGQVFLNLLINAAHAIAPGATNQNQITVRAFLLGERVVVEIEDTGSGMSPEVQQRIFDPFFTTKPVGVGTGLGLAICHGIVQAAGGDIQVASTLGEGSTFRVLLRPATPVTVAPRPVAHQAGVRRQVLIVDDEPMLAAALKRRLSRVHEVVTTVHARQALELLAIRSFDVILCDLMMPEMTGEGLHAEIERRHPALAKRMIFLSGGASTPELRAFIERFPTRRLDKPVDFDALRTLIDGVARS